MYGVSDIVMVSKIKGLTEGDRVKGLLLLKDYKKKKTKTDSYYMDGTLEGVGNINFKAWGNSEAFDKLDVQDYSNEVVSIFGKVNVYNGSYSIIVEDLNPVDLSGASITKEDFFASRYDGNQYFDATRKLLVKMVDVPSVEIFDKVIKPIKDRFILEFAAKSHHDNCKSGLIAHTYKCLAICRILTMYPDIIEQQGNSLSLIALGVALHDIGKVMEYTNGSVKGTGMIVSHHTFGVELLLQNKGFIIERKGEDFFYRLCAIVEQHHGKYEETPRTIEAYIVHMIDNMESTLQVLSQEVADLPSGSQIYFDDCMLC